MKKILLLILYCCFTIPKLNAQWTWMHGDSAFYGGILNYNLNAVYGPLGVAGPNYQPNESPQATYWNDKSGNLWIYDGSMNITGSTKNHDELWKYNPSSNMWTFMFANNSFNPVYSTLGVPAPGNSPGKMYTEQNAWTDNNDDLWLTNSHDSGSVWKYFKSLNQWACMVKGGNLNWGTKNVAAPSNRPGIRGNSVWPAKDKNGNIWINAGTTGTITQYYDSFFIFDMSSLNWVWKGGNNVQVQRNYGTKGISAANVTPANTNMPIGARWFDDVKEEVYFLDNIRPVLWKYNINSDQYTWVSGDTSTSSKNGHYGTKCTPSPGNHPPLLLLSDVSLKDSCGKFWLYGGLTSGAVVTAKRNTLWKFDPLTNNWTWISGDTTADVLGSKTIWGTKGVESPLNNPIQSCWASGVMNKGLHLFIGGANGRNTIWRYAPKPHPDFEYSEIDCYNIAFNDKSEAECGGDLKSWFWDFGDGTTSNIQHPTHIYKDTGYFEIKLIVKNCLCITDTLTRKVYVSGKGQLPSSVLSANINDATCKASNGSILLNTNFPAGVNYTLSWNPPVSTTTSAVNLAPGNYTVTFSLNNGCEATKTYTIASVDKAFQVNETVKNPDCKNKNGEIILAPAITGNYTFNWNPPVSNTAAAYDILSGVYTIKITDFNGCEQSKTVSLTKEIPVIVINTVANIFTPNGDGVNDEYFFEAGNFEVLDIVIFDRWGKQVFKSSGTDFRWKGNATNGENLSSGVYFYIMKYKNECDEKNHEFKGTIELMK